MNTTALLGQEMRRLATTGPRLTFNPEGVVVFKGAHREQGFEVLNATIEIRNDSMRTVHFRFDNDPEFKFTPHRGCIPSRSTTAVKATFYNVDGHCYPRRSSVGLRAIRVHNDDPMDVEVTWRRTPETLVTHKRWKFKFEMDASPALPRDVATPPSSNRSRQEDTVEAAQVEAGGYGDVSNAEDASQPATSTWITRAVRFCTRWLLLELALAVTVVAAYTAYRAAANAEKSKPDPADCVTIWDKEYCF